MSRPQVGQTVRILKIRGEGHGIEVGDLMVVGEDRNPPEDMCGFTWLQSPEYPLAGSKCGWVQWELAGQPAPAPFPRPGQRVRVTKSHSAVGLTIGDVITIATISHAVNSSYPGAVWLSAKLDADLQSRFGWVNWEAVAGEEEPAITGQSTESLSATVRRQRRELRRLNQAVRLHKLEAQKASRVAEDTMQILLDTRRELRAFQNDS